MCCAQISEEYQPYAEPDQKVSPTRYAGLVLLATRVLPLHTPVAVAGSTLVAAAMFNPPRRRVQLEVDVVHQALEPAMVSVWMNERG